MPIVAVILFALIGFAGLSVDKARVSSFEGQLGSAADAAALAAVQTLRADAGPLYPLTRSAAVDFARKNAVDRTSLNLDPNYGNQSDGDIVIGRWDASMGAFQPDIEAPNAVLVNARRTATSSDGPVDTFFGQMFGVTRVNVAQRSIAAVSSGGALLLVLDPVMSSALDISGNATVDVSAGVIQVNSNDSCAFDFGGSATLVMEAMNINGRACTGSGAGITGPIHENAGAVRDPLTNLLPGAGDWNALRASLPLPLGSKGQIKKGGVFLPGYYPLGLKISSKSNVTLLPGTYMFGGKGVEVSGQARVAGQDVTLLIDLGSDLRLNGGNAFEISAPTTGEFAGVAIFHHRNNSGDDQWVNNGNAGVDIQGTTYVPAGGLRINGTPTSRLGVIIADRVRFNGNPDVIVTGDGRTDAPPARLVY